MSLRGRIAASLEPWLRQHLGGLRFRSRLDRSPHVAIKDLAGTRRVHIEGLVVAVGEPLTSPIQPRLCVWYDGAIELERPPDSGFQWAQRIYLQGGQDFIVRDPTGEVLVRIAGARVVAQTAASYRVRLGRVPLDEPTATVRAIMQAHEVQGQPRVRAVERILRSGDRVAVMGRLTPGTQLDPSAAFAGYRDVALRPMLVDSRDEPLIIGDPRQI